MNKLAPLFSPAALCAWLIAICMGFSIIGSNASRTIALTQHSKFGAAKVYFPIEMRRWDEALFNLLYARSKSDMADFLKSAEQDVANRSGDPDYSGWKAYDQTVRYIEQFRSPTLVSYLEVTTTAAGRAVPATEFKTINFDKVAKREMTLGDFVEGAVDRSKTLNALSEYMRADLKDQTGEDEESEALFDATKPDLAPYEKFTLCSSTKGGKAAGLTFHLAPNAISSFPESHFHVTIPYTVFSKFLKLQMRPLFTGEPRQIPVDLQDEG